jgi:dipeptidyl aminopeptidase/acylaminoacyl peptidase
MIFPMKKFIFLLSITTVLCISSYSQYFGQNKPSYKKFDFKVYHTPHFQLYHYLKNDSVLNRLAQLSEQWYSMHQTMFRDTFKTQNPIIFYNDQADFQQTTAISGLIDVGVGGVTEALKNRVVLPIASSYAQTDHVLGHEMVHAFQYHSLLGDSANYNMLRNLPLWMIEGMAEYFSIGSVDAHTALWMRDAIVNNDFPTLDMMSRNYKYFPYRFGQCFWSMVGRTWGDSIIMPLFRESAMLGYPLAVRRVLGYDENALSAMWKSTMVNHFQKYLDVALTTPVGKKILFAKNAGDMNISPSLSPNGKYIIFLSEKEIFTLDLYLADARTGRIIRKLSSTIQNSEIDAFNFIESAGSWSPDGKHFVFTIFAGGRNKLLLVNVDKGKVVGEFQIPDVPAFSNPVWSPSGDQIVVSGMVEGINNLYLFDLKTKAVKRLTNGPYAYMQPAWSNDGKYIIFSTDKPLNEGSLIDIKGGMNIALMDMKTYKITPINVFPGAKNLNPVFAPDNQSFYFLSNRDGFRNLYRYQIDSSKVYQYTRFFTGITGITEFSPAISVARNIDLLSYTYFYGGKYSIYSANKDDFKPFEVKTDSVNFDAATLPPLERVGNNAVDKQLSNRDSLKLVSTDKFMTSPYRPKFQLDYISNVNVGVAASRFGTGMAGSVLGIFSDIVGQNQLYTMLSLNGEIYDFGGQVAYINSKNKINWGASVSHIPYMYAYYDYTGYYDSRENAWNYPIELIRVFEDKFSLFAMRPISKTRRFEFGISTALYYHRIDTINQYDKGSYYYQTKTRGNAPPGYNLQTIDCAYVTDNSFFGMTAPMRGSRSRIGVEKYFGEFTFITALLDLRKYWYVKPYTFAIRAMQYGRYGYGASDSRLNQLYLGYPWYMRGYEYSTFTNNNFISDSLDVSINDLMGSKMGLFNFEFRFPFTGPKKIALIESGFLMSDLVLFMDAGIAWTDKTHPKLKFKKSNETDRIPLVSVGGSLRINVFGYMVIEPYYAFPLQYGGFKNPVFGVNFQPGW